MINEEEKKAFNYYKDCNEKDLELFDYLTEGNKKTVVYMKLLLNLIKEQQKEIEELKAFYNSFESGEIVSYPIFKQRYISKDKIREKIKELEWVEEVYKCQCDSCRDIRDEGRYMAYKKLLEEEEYE